tara:strand:- start:96 stop:1145 length:1050 start_codon:yes stop_codon:yes gene_type:complete
MSYNSAKIIRKGYLAEKIIIVDGQPGCGKTMLSPIISSMDRVELISYAFEIEFICRLFYLNKIEKDAAVSMVRMLTDHKLYQTMMSRETNFRYSDISSVFKDPNPWRYFKRIFQEGDISVPEKIKKNKPILNLTTHDLLNMSLPIFEGLSDRVVFIEVIRHPLYMLIQQTLNFERLLSNPRDIQVYIEHKGHEVPYFAYNWEEIFSSANSVERAIYAMQNYLQLKEKIKRELEERFLNKVITIPFEKFVLEPSSYINLIESSIGTVSTDKTVKIMKKQKVPRKKISDGIPLNIYKRCGWEPPDKSLTEKEELNKRREFAIHNNAGGKALEILDKISSLYESKYYNHGSF